MRFVQPMMGWENKTVYNEQIYWKNIIPKDYKP